MPISDQERCGRCWKKIHQQRNGAWYHDHNASVKCKPGQDDKKAFPGGSEPWRGQQLVASRPDPSGGAR